MALGVEKFGEVAQGEHDPARFAVAGGAVAFTTIAHYLVHKASEQHTAAEQESRTQLSHLVRRGMLTALRQALTSSPRPPDSIYDSLARGWEEALGRALRKRRTT
jgi:hypothetical protein